MAHTDQDAFAGGPDILDPLVLAVVLHLLVDAVGSAPERKLPESDQVAFAEKVLNGRGGLFGHIHFAFPQTLKQVVGRQVDELDLIGAVEEKVGDCFSHVDAGYLGDDVVQALKMLHVHGSVDGNPRPEQFIDVLPALLMA